MNWRKLPLSAEQWPALADNPQPYAGLLTSLSEERDYVCSVEGELPPLTGTLYRIGPGLYDRGPDRKRMMLDGDGMVQALQFANGVARYRNRYVQTQKYIDEGRAGHLLYPTFSTHGSGPLRLNLGLKLGNQANTTVLEWAGRLWAFDESQTPYELGLDLHTQGPRSPDSSQPGLRYWAHWKLDANRRQLHLLAIDQGRGMTAHVVTLAADGQVAARRKFKLPRAVYFHDWFVTENYFAFLLHPAFVSPAKLLKVILARETFAHAVDWQPHKGSILHVVHRQTDWQMSLRTRPVWMWHAVNAFEQGDNLICDFVGSQMGGGLGSESSPLFKVMRGEAISMPQRPINWLRRYKVDYKKQTLDESVIDSTANFELPCVSATERAKAYKAAYLIQADPGDLFAHSLCRFDAESMSTQTFSFGAHQFCSEPVVLDTLSGPRARFVVTQIYDAIQKKSHFAVLDETRFAQGPVARIMLEHHVPLSFHGFWSSQVS